MPILFPALPALLSLPRCLDAPLQSANALSFDELQGLTYLQVKGTGIANTCPNLTSGSSNYKDLKPGSYKMSNFCLEPTSFTVKEESQVRAKAGLWGELGCRCIWCCPRELCWRP
jgi:hypothetical protein